MKNIIRITLVTFVLSFLVLPAAIQAQEQDEKEQNQYLLSRFTKGVVGMKTGMPIESFLNYNCLTEEMIFIQDGPRLALANLENIDTVYLDDRLFVPFGEVFYEVVVDGYADLFIQNKSKADIQGEEVGYGGTSQLSNVKSLSSMRANGQFFYMDMPENIKVKPDPTYWVRYEGKMSIVYNKRTILKAFPGIESELKSYFKSKKIDFDNISEIGEIVKFVNGLK